MRELARQNIWNVLRVVQTATGFSLGVYLYIYGLFFFEKFGGDMNPVSVTWTTTIFVIGNAVVLLLDIPTGALADYFGRQRAVVWSFLFRSSYFLILGVTCFVFNPETAFALGVLAYGLFGVGYALFSGALIAWVVDAVRHAELPEGHGPMITASYKYLFTAQLIGAVAGLWLYMQGLVFMGFVAGFAACILCSLYCFYYMEENRGFDFQHGRVDWGAATKQSIEKIQLAMRVFRKNPIVFYLSVLYAIFMFLNHIVAYLWPVYMKSNFGFGKLSMLWFGIVIASISLRRFGSQILGFGGKKYEDQGLAVPNPLMRAWFVSSCIAVTIPIFSLNALVDVSMTTLVIFVVTVLLVNVGYGFMRPCFETLVNNYIPAQDAHERATVLSVANMLISFFVILLMIPAGGDSGKGTAEGWLIPASALFGLGIIAHFLMKYYEKRAEENHAPADTKILPQVDSK